MPIDFENMTEGPVKRTIPKELRERLLDISLQTDIIAEHRGIDSWRVSAVSAARWLLRTAAESDDIPRGMKATLRQIAGIAAKMSDMAQERRTESGELRLELERFRDDEDC